MDIQITVNLTCQKCGNAYNRTISLPPDCAPPSPDSLKSCVVCSGEAPVPVPWTEKEEVKRKRTAERLKDWRDKNKVWARIDKMLRRAGVEVTKAAAVQFTEKWIAKVEAIGDTCSFCVCPCDPETFQFWRDPAGDPLDPRSYWPVCAGCAGRKRAEVRWKKAA